MKFKKITKEQKIDWKSRAKRLLSQVWAMVHFTWGDYSSQKPGKVIPGRKHLSQNNEAQGCLIWSNSHSCIDPYSFALNVADT
jgi:hypothetical protein